MKINWDVVWGICFWISITGCVMGGATLVAMDDASPPPSNEAFVTWLGISIFITLVGIIGLAIADKRING